MKKVAIQGTLGSYHDIAAHKYFEGEEIELICCANFEDVFGAIKKDSQTIGMLAIENTIAGSLLHNNELLRQSGAQIVGEYKLTTHAGVPSELIEWHGHNDFYKAVTNSTTAWLYGACGVNCSLFGIGERTGNTPLEAMVFEYAQLKGTLDGMDTTVITDLVDYFEKDLDYTLPSRTPFCRQELQCNKSRNPCRRIAEKRRNLQYF